MRVFSFFLSLLTTLVLVWPELTIVNESQLSFLYGPGFKLRQKKVNLLFMSDGSSMLAITARRSLGNKQIPAQYN